MRIKRFLSFPICMVLSLMAFVYYTTVFIFIEDWLGLRSSAGTLHMLIFSFFAFMSFFSFGACVLIDPGNVPSTFVPDVEDDGGSDHRSRKSGAHSRYCDKCSTYKPPRAHHCRVCERCVLRMDHHCLWVNNCVGFSNYKPFVVLITYTTVGCIYSLVMIMSGALQKDWEFGPLKMVYITCGSIIGVLCLILVTLLGWHLYLLSHNMTTIEYHEGIRAKWLARKSGKSYHHRYNVGFYRNITLILGPNMLKWFCPTSISHLKDGISFPAVRDGS
ncbi:probable protein S-acyltransferase 15 isoform X2 [Telopea speciosissima]|uniref:probable protein S-acyltransferase 15 isoform X2 n=1 Tax=Telopea speciosissima TaxID=54955 RepID=UPI001CC37FB0|nr:probable protein S-acyltransferase 15 isoform X2 [Telopea speciosissima]